MKLGKNEKRVLVLLLEPTKSEPYLNYPKEGKSIGLLAEDVYPNKQVREKYPGLMGINNLLNSVMVSLTNTLNSLHRKYLVIKAKPIYKRKWEPKNNDKHFGGSGYMTKNLIGFKNARDNWDVDINITKYTELPDKTKLWWILTDKGRELAEKLISENPELDKLIGYYYKNRIEKEKRKLIKRCNRCNNFDWNEMYCKIEEMQGIEYEIGYCKYCSSIDEDLSQIDD